MQSSTSQKWEGRWDQLKGKVRQFWGKLTDDDLEKSKGDYTELIGIIKEKTGETREEIERRLNS
jgi:uncharacterized protein YjbJ (UPF0337 family)